MKRCDNETTICECVGEAWGIMAELESSQPRFEGLLTAFLSLRCAGCDDIPALDC